MQGNRFPFIRMLNGNLGVIAGIAALGIALYVGARLSAKGRDTAVPRPTSRIGVANMQTAIEKHKRIADYKKGLEGFVRFYEDKQTAIKTAVAKAEEKLKDAPAVEKAAFEKEMIAYKLQLEKLNKEFKIEMKKKQEAELVTLYREIEEVVKGIAKEKDLEMVLQYNELIDPEDAYNPKLLAQKVHPGTCMPMFVAPGLDITAAVIAKLNRSYKRPK